MSIPTYEQATNPKAGPDYRIARKTKRCTTCGERIPAGNRYVLVTLWNWVCTECFKAVGRP